MGRSTRWAILKNGTGRFTASFLLAALDLKRAETGDIVQVPAERRLYVPLLVRTFEISLKRRGDLPPGGLSHGLRADATLTAARPDCS